MIKFQEIKVGDLLLAEFEGKQVEGIVKDLNKEDKEVCIETDVQQFWFTTNHLNPIPLSERHLSRLGFTKQANGDGSAKYSKNSFRMLLPREGDFSEMEIWWREDRRHLVKPIHVHELQNHYYEMTKVELNQE